MVEVDVPGALCTQVDPGTGSQEWRVGEPGEEIGVRWVLNNDIVFRQTGLFWFSGLPVFSRLKAAN